MTRALYEQIRDEELAKLGGARVERYVDAEEILDQLILNDEFLDFLTPVAYGYLD